MLLRPTSVVVALGWLLAASTANAGSLPERAQSVLEDESYQDWLPGLEGGPSVSGTRGFGGGAPGNGGASTPGVEGRSRGAPSGTSGAGGVSRRERGGTGSGEPTGPIAAEGESTDAKGGASPTAADGHGSGERGSEGPTAGGEAEGRGGSNGVGATGGSNDGGAGGQPGEAGAEGGATGPPGAQSEPRGRDAAGDRLSGLNRDRPPREVTPPPPRDLEPVSVPISTSPLVWLAYVVGAALLAVALFAFFRSLAARTTHDEDGTTLVTEPAVLPEPGHPPRDLADEGRYGEAVHAMLLLALKHLAERGGLAARHSATSREVLTDSALDGASRRHLEVLVNGVERWWFGGHELTRDEYERCKTAWASLWPGLGAR